MITLPFKIKECDDLTFVQQKQENYSFAFRKLYKRIDLINNSEFIKYLQSKFKMSRWEVDCLRIEVKTKYNQVDTQKDIATNRIISIENQLKVLNSDTKKSKNKLIRDKFKLKNKLNSLDKLLSKDIVFGGKVLLKQLSHLNNNKTLNERQITETKSKWNKARLLPINLIGETFRDNRHFDFDLTNDHLVYNPYKGKKINIIFRCDKKYQKRLNQIQSIIKQKVIPINIKLTTDHVYITYDNEKINGFGFKKTELYKELNQVDKDHISTEIKDNLKKQIKQKYCKEQNERRSDNKIQNRYLGIDLNPNYIGYSIIDSINDKIKIIKSECFDLNQLNTKNKKSSSDPKTKKQNNKRKYEISLIYKYIFNQSVHFNVNFFINEDLNFKPTELKENKEFNRQTKFLWNRDFQKHLISKYCSENGIINHVVRPHYSSFIGNICYDYIDPVNASIEIARRGIYKFTPKNTGYPTITDTNVDTMTRLISDQTGDVLLLKDCITWKDYFDVFNETKSKYRFYLSDLQRSYKSFSMNNTKSKVKLYSF
jgi:hypothetical protein